jgi:hypothetical protein
MKFSGLALFFCFILNISLFSFSYSQKWIDTKLNYSNSSNGIRVIYHKEIPEKSTKNLIRIIENGRDLNSKTKNNLFAENDLLVFSKKYLYWFSLSNKSQGRVVRSAGGLLAGLWELEFNKKTNKISFKNFDKKTKFAKSLLLTGSSKNVKLFGQDIFGGYKSKNTRVIWGLEYSKNVKITKKTGKDILSLDKGAYSSDEGVFIQFSGIVGNSPLIGKGIETETDTDPRKGIVGKTIFELNYRIPAEKLEFVTEVEFKAVKNNFGPISNSYISMYLPGYSPNNMVYASNPELMPINTAKETTKKNFLKDVSVNKYFRNSAVKRSFFYDIVNRKSKSSKNTVRTPPGRGRILCLGSPLNKIGFLCGYPNNDYIPKATYEEYVLEMNQNNNSKKFGKFHTLNYKLLSSTGKTITINQGQKLTMIMRYKLINASAPLPQNKRSGK